MKDQIRVIHGDDVFMRSRFIQEWSAFLAQKGFVTIHLEDEDSIASHVGGLSSLFGSGGKEHLVTTVWEEGLDVEMLGSSCVTFSLDRLPRTKEFKKTLERLKVKPTTFETPPPWKAEERAVTFMVKEAKRRGLALNEALAKVWVSKVGFDLGVLSFEVEKALLFQGPGPVEITTVQKVMAPLEERDPSRLLDIVLSRDPKTMFNALREFKALSPQEPTFKFTRFTAPSIQKWLMALACSKQSSLSEDQAAEILGVNPWFYKNTILPKAQSLGYRRIRGLVQVLSDAETLAYQSSTDPWAFLTSRLLLWAMEA